MIIDRAAHQAMLDHLQQAAPREGCGLLAGPRRPQCARDTDGDGGCGRRHCSECGGGVGRVVDRWVPLDNVSDFPRLRYEVDNRQLIDVWNQLDADGRRPWIMVHSHVNHGPEPSEMDIRYALDESLLHLIVSIGGVAAYPRLWVIRPNLASAHMRARGVPYDVVDLQRKEYPATDLTRGVSGA